MIPGPRVVLADSMIDLGRPGCPALALLSLRLPVVNPRLSSSGKARRPVRGLTSSSAASTEAGSHEAVRRLLACRARDRRARDCRWAGEDR
jgi:hypothetical protein